MRPDDAFSDKDKSNADKVAKHIFAGIRTSDVRYEGVHLLAEYIVQSGKIFHAAQNVMNECEKLTHSVDQQRRELIELVKFTQESIISAESRFKECTSEQIKASQKAHTEMLETLRQEMIKNEQQRSELDEQRTDLTKKQAALERDREKLNQLGLWARVTKKF